MLEKEQMSQAMNRFPTLDLHSHAKNETGTITEQNETHSFFLDQCLFDFFRRLFLFIVVTESIGDNSLIRMNEFPFPKIIKMETCLLHKENSVYLGGSASTRDAQYNIQSATCWSVCTGLLGLFGDELK